MTLFSLTWAVFCAVSSGLFGEVVFSLQEDKWDTSKDERIQWRYQHAQAAVVNIVDQGRGKGKVGLRCISLTLFSLYQEKIDNL